MAQYTRDTFQIIIFMELDTILGTMEECIRGNGRTTKCMDKEFLDELMEEVIRESIEMTKRKDLESLYDLMGKSI